MFTGGFGGWQAKICPKTGAISGPPPAVKTAKPGRFATGLQLRNVRMPAYSTFFKNWMPLTAISFVVGSMRRQMAAARAITFTSVVKLSITRSPL